MAQLLGALPAGKQTSWAAKRGGGGAVRGLPVEVFGLTYDHLPSASRAAPLRLLHRRRVSMAYCCSRGLSMLCRLLRRPQLLQRRWSRIFRRAVAARARRRTQTHKKNRSASSKSRAPRPPLRSSRLGARAVLRALRTTTRST